MQLRSFLALVAVAALGLATGCGSNGSSGGRSTGLSVASATPASLTSGTVGSTASSAATASVPFQAAPEVVPVVVVHGHGGDAAGFAPFLERFGPGRSAVAELCAAEADQLKPGDLPRASVVVASFYKESIGGVLYDIDPQTKLGTGSIGGCPAPRNDGRAGKYPVSYAHRLSRIVEGVRRATGSDRVDLVLHSMGNLVGRAYARWLSDGAAGGKSKVRRILCVAGPHRGINAIEATVDGLEHDGDREFMRMGECAEMCYEYTAWQGRSFTDHLNDGWDAWCGAHDVRYGGFSATGAHGKQIDPNGGPPTKAFGLLTLSSPFDHIWKAVNHLSFKSFGEVFPFVALWAPRAIAEYKEATGPGDGTVRLASSRLDQAPFARAEFWAPFEARHSDEFNPEQAAHASTFTSELTRQYFSSATLGTKATAAAWELKLRDAPGKASFLELDTSVLGGSLVAAQIVEEKLDASGKPVGGAEARSVVLPEGNQSAFVQVPAGGGDRAYHVVLYGPNGAVATKDFRVHLMDGALEDGPRTTFVGATPALSGQGPVVHASYASNTAAGDPSLRYSYRLDDGAWTAWGPAASFDTPALAAGEHRLEARAQHSRNGAAAPVSDARGIAIGILVDASGTVTIRK